MNTSYRELRHTVLFDRLRHCPLFSDCAASLLHEIAALTFVRSLDTGDYLFYEGTHSGGLFVVQHGAIKLHRVTALQREIIIHVFRPPESLGEDGLCSEVGCSASARATEPSQVLVVPKAGLIALLGRHPELSLKLLRGLARQFSLLVARIDELTLKDVSTRVVDWLLQHCRNPESSEPQSVQVTETKRLLAAELGTRCETLSRTLAKLRNQRLLSVQGRTLTLACPRRLANLFRDETGGVVAFDRPCPDSAVACRGHDPRKPCRSQAGRVCLC